LELIGKPCGGRKGHEGVGQSMATFHSEWVKEVHGGGGRTSTSTRGKKGFLKGVPTHEFEGYISDRAAVAYGG